MSNPVHQIRRAAGMVVSLALLSGCVLDIDALAMKVPVKDPVPSAHAYRKTDADPSHVTLVFKDERTFLEQSVLLTGSIPMRLVRADEPFEPLPWVAQHTVAEMRARGVPVGLGDKLSSGLRVLVQRFHVENERASFTSPFVTSIMLSAEVVTDQGPRRIAAYVVRARTPVRSFDEVVDPTYNDALAMVTKEFAAKLTQVLFRESVDDSTIAALVDKIEADANDAAQLARAMADSNYRPDPWLETYHLALGNNPAAIPELVKLCAHPSESVRLAAISGLGILKARDHFDLLVQLHQQSYGSWEERAMALKALGDLDTPAGRAYLKQERKRLRDRSDEEARRLEDVISLYL